jgi:hypothetical protein
VEGAFRISGSAKRMRELQQIFDTGPKVSRFRRQYDADSASSTGRISTGRNFLLPVTMLPRSSEGEHQPKLFAYA